MALSFFPPHHYTCVPLSYLSFLLWYYVFSPLLAAPLYSCENVMLLSWVCCRREWCWLGLLCVNSLLTAECRRDDATHLLSTMLLTNCVAADEEEGSLVWPTKLSLVYWTGGCCGRIDFFCGALTVHDRTVPINSTANEGISDNAPVGFLGWDFCHVGCYDRICLPCRRSSLVNRRRSQEMGSRDAVIRIHFYIIGYSRTLFACKKIYN